MNCDIYFKFIISTIFYFWINIQKSLMILFISAIESTNLNIIFYGTAELDI